MSGDSTFQGLRDFEDSWSTNLEGTVKEVISAIKAHTPADNTFTTQQMTFLTEFLREAERRLQVYERPARWFSERGLPNLATRLPEVLRDIRTARATYLEKLRQHRAASQEELAALRRRIAEECNRIFDETMKARADAVDAWFAQWRATNFPGR